MVALCGMVDRRGALAADGLFPVALARRRHGGPARLFAASPLATSAVAYGASVAAGTYMIAAEMVGWGVLCFFLVLSLAMALVQALELVETVWRRRWSREAMPAGPT